MKTRIIKINPKEIKLLEVNARFMKHEEFQRLVDNVKRDGELTSVPFCCLDEDGTYLCLSGNHRVQAAIAAELEKIRVMVTDEPLTHSQKVAIQLSHNSIAGEDDLAILKQLYESIEDFDYKQYSGLDDKTLELLEKIGAESMSAFNLEYQIMNIAFLPDEISAVTKIIKNVKKEVGKNKTLLVKMESYDKFLDAMDDISSARNIKNVATVFDALLNVVNNHLEDFANEWLEEEPKQSKWVPVSTIINRTRVRQTDGQVINKAIERMISKGEVKKSEKDSALRILAEKYLISEGVMKESEKPAKKEKKKGKE